MSDAKVAVILDLVDSRQIADRAAAQKLLERAFAVVNDAVDHLEPFAATVGDEFQAVYSTLADALEATLLARLSMPEGLDARVGIGCGKIRSVGTGMTGVLQDGSAWWAARSAIDEAHLRADTRVPTLRSWYQGKGEPLFADAAVNAYLLGRDYIVGGMSARERRLALGRWLGNSQSVLAEKEGVSQSAVSQSLRRAGVTALQAGIVALREAGGEC
ncbi:hypothetical protein B7R21_10705 [Subtercola boreus]|uniref:SatD family protein n=1 Tax=Subtercola boreus TaxID=120213 RepID=A0A3E0VVD0_9MICO|nr:SatD family protein [Subtercola boreus]RFA12787.1 hypothetical protein B7R21_10705 [Subtercola boreus]